MNITTDSTFAEIETALYELPFPARPAKPNIATLGKDKTPADYRAYADALEIYERYMVEHQAQVANYHADRTRLETIWKEKLRNEHSDLNDATFDVCYSKAYQDGHSAGYSDVRNCMIDIADLAEKIITANK